MIPALGAGGAKFGQTFAALGGHFLCDASCPRGCFPVGLATDFATALNRCVGFPKFIYGSQRRDTLVEFQPGDEAAVVALWSPGKAMG